MNNMEIFSKVFLIATSGLFIALFMLMIEHPKRKIIGLIIFGIVALLAISSLPFLMLISMFCPLLILLDVKRLSVKICLIYLSCFTIIGGVWALFIIDFVPFYLYPVLIFLYAIYSKISFERTRIKNKQIEEII